MEKTEYSTRRPWTSNLTEVVNLFLRLGFTAFGGPAAHIAMMRQEVVERRHWVTDQRFIDLLGVINLIPGPNSTQLAIYLGYIRAGWLGLVLGGICFIGPAMLIVLALAWLYVHFGTLPQVGGALYGIKAVVIAIIAQALWGLARTVLKGAWAVMLAVLVLLLYLLGVNGLLLLVGGGLLFGVLRWVERRRLQPQGQKDTALSIAWPVLPGSLYTIERLWQAITLSPLTDAALVTAPVSLLTLFLVFLKLGATVYGSGYVLLAFLRSDLIEGLHWLSERQLLDAVSIGQFTPGPVFTTATFIGYLVKGWQGALLATLGIFLPSFVFIAVIHRLATTLRSIAWTAAILDGVNIAALALMAGVLLQLGQNALLGQDLLSNLLAWLIALGALVVLFRYKINSAWLILVAALIGVLKIWL